MRNNMILVLSALLIVFGASSCEKYKSDTYDLNKGRTNNYILVPAALQTDTLVFDQGDTLDAGGPLLTSRVSFPDALTATMVLDAEVPGIQDITYTSTLAAQMNSWTPVIVIPDNYLPAGVDSTYATLRLTSVTGPTSGQLRIGYLPDDNSTISLLIYR